MLSGTPFIPETITVHLGPPDSDAQNVTVDVPSGYKVVVVPSSVNVPQAVSVTTSPQTVYVAPAATPAPVYRAHPYARHVASVGEGMVIEHQIDDHH